MPVNAKDIVDYYTSLRPKDAAHFFCAKDGAPFQRSDVLNILHMCLLGTDWRYLNIMPHSFCQGRVSEALLVGEDVMDIRNDRRWTASSAAFETYARSDLVALDPDFLFRNYPKYRKHWKVERFRYLAQNVVETAGDVRYHPFSLTIKSHFPTAFAAVRHFFPSFFPHSLYNLKLRELKERIRTQSVLTSHRAKESMDRAKKARKASISYLMRKQTLNFHYEESRALKPVVLPADISDI